MAFELKLALTYLQKNKKESITIIISIVIAMTLILGVDIIGNSMSINQISQAKKIAGYYDGTLTSNNKESEEKIKKIDLVYNVSTVENLGQITIQGGLKSTLYTFNENYFKSMNYTIISGRYPKNENEIIIDSKLLGKYEKNNILNKRISGVNKIEYYLDGINGAYSKKNEYKVVGVISKVDDYYSLEDIEIDSFIGGNKNIIPGKFITYSTIYNIKGINESNIDQKLSDIRKEYDPTSDYKIDIRKDVKSGISTNQYLDSALRLYKDVQQGNEKEMKILVAITASLTIFNFFNIILSKMINQIGYLRIVGMSNKKITRFYLMQMLILYGIGITIGFITSIFFAKYTMGIFIQSNLFDISNFSNIKLIISPFIVSKSLLITLSALLISILIPIISSLKKYPIDLINKSDKVKYKTKHNKKLLNTLLKNNLLRSKSKTIISIAIIAFSGFMFILCTSSNMKESLKQIRGNLLGCKKEYNYMIRPYENAAKDINKISIKEISSIKNFKGIKDFSVLNYTTGFVDVPKNDLNKVYFKMYPIKANNEGNVEVKALVSGIYDYNKLNKYVKAGSLENIDKLNDEYINIAICNEDYVTKTKKIEKTINGLKVGDIFKFKVLSKNNSGENQYKTYKYKVNAILDSSIAQNNGVENHAQAIGMYMNPEVLKSITNNNYIQEVNFNITGQNNKELDKSIENIDKKYDFIDITTPKSKDQDVTIKFDRRLILGSVLLVAALFNIYTTISINIKNNISEFSILRAIGLEKKYFKKLVVYEAVFYSLVGSIIGATLACIKEFKIIDSDKKIYAKVGINLNISDVYTPPKEAIMFVLIVVLVAILIGYSKAKLIDKLDIIDGINEN
ncbi:ABC transporter permease [Romboutsia lituseburensis]|uniref:ABC transporter permease n=1 Tax=Romboutsia lituseburensis TaxID=1537 RepID=UPI00215AD07E|nr:FtsX-like permease family protein [Romboutsia lituseburensis]MCR8747220.1 FtsX-like permease family protein [Romboutsia lituseburensis]